MPTAGPDGRDEWPARPLALGTTTVTWFLLYDLIGWAILLAMVPVILRRQFSPGASLAWLGIVFLHPYIGLMLYLLIGESRLARRRAERHGAVHLRPRAAPMPAADAGTGADRPTLVDVDPAYEPMVLQARTVGGMPVVGGNTFELLPDAAQFVERLAADIDAARSEVHLLYYIFAPDATGGRIAAALERAAARGVRCRVLADAVASRPFFLRPFGQSLARRLAAAGVAVVPALPVDPIRRGIGRMDFRNHRKLAVIDAHVTAEADGQVASVGGVAYCGSHNLINPDYGGRRGGPWVDLTARLTGPVVGQFATVFAEDWAFETGQVLELPTPLDVERWTSDVGRPEPATPLASNVQRPTLNVQLPTVPTQVVATGPASPGETFRRVVLAAVNSARERVTLTTPYFVPDEATLLALQMAADRGVRVTLILPERPDHFFTAAAGRAHFEPLLRSGVSIHLYRPCLLHAKTTTVDDAFAIVGSANLDLRSFNLNFELSVLLYGREATDRVRQAQAAWLADARPLDLAEWERRPLVRQYADRAVSLLSPLL